MRLDDIVIGHYRVAYLAGTDQREILISAKYNVANSKQYVPKCDDRYDPYYRYIFDQKRRTKMVNVKKGWITKLNGHGARNMCYNIPHGQRFSQVLSTMRIDYELAQVGLQVYAALVCWCLY